MSSPDPADLLAGVKLATILRRGDRVLLVVDGRAYTPEHVEFARLVLREKFPGVEFVFATGIDEVLVQPGPDPGPLPDWVTRQAVPGKSAPKETDG